MRSFIARRRLTRWYCALAQHAWAGLKGGSDNEASLVAVVLAVFTTTASAQDKRPDYGTAVNAAAAKKIAADVIAECQKNSWNLGVALVDNHGFLVYFERMDNTQTASIDIAVGKPGRRRPTDARPASLRTSSTRGGRPPLHCPACSPRPAACRSWSTARSSAASASATRTSNAPRPGSASSDGCAEVGARPVSARRAIGLSLSPFRY